MLFNNRQLYFNDYTFLCILLTVSYKQQTPNHKPKTENRKQ